MKKTKKQKYDAWQFPDPNNLKQEYHVEYELKHLKNMLGDV